MTQRQSLKTIGTGTALAVLVLGGMLISPGRGQDSGNDDESRIQQGLAIAPVKLYNYRNGGEFLFCELIHDERQACVG